MVEDLTGNIRRIIDGLAKEIALRCDDDPDITIDPITAIEIHTRQVLLDWFLGDFLPGQHK